MIIDSDKGLVGGLDGISKNDSKTQEQRLAVAAKLPILSFLAYVSACSYLFSQGPFLNLPVPLKGDSGQFHEMW